VLRHATASVFFATAGLPACGPLAAAAIYRGDPQVACGMGRAKNQAPGYWMDNENKSL